MGNYRFQKGGSDERFFVQKDIEEGIEIAKLLEKMEPSKRPFIEFYHDKRKLVTKRRMKYHSINRENNKRLSYENRNTDNRKRAELWKS